MTLKLFNQVEHISPPKWPLKLLRFFVKNEYLEEIEGDMEEVFQGNLETHSLKKARRIYSWEMVKLMRPIITKNLEGAFYLNQYGMFRNYFKVARRGLWRKKWFATINILGLTISISVALIVFLVVHHEYGYDNFHKQQDRIYRVVSEFNFGGDQFYNSGIAPAIPKAMENDISGLELVAPIYQFYPAVAVPLQSTKSSFEPRDVIYTNKNFFEIFNYQWLSGSFEHALSDPYGIVLTRSRCERYFNSSNYSEHIGKTLVYNDSITLTLKGVVDDLKEKSDLNFNEFVSWPTIKAAGLEDQLAINVFDGTTNYSQVYVKSHSGVPAVDIEEQFPAFLSKYTDDEYTPILRMQALNDIHFSVNYPGTGRSANKSTMYLLLGLALFLLILGSVNYINLSTAQSMTRFKEIGIRKYLGSSKVQLVWLSIIESVMLALFATIAAFLVVPLLIKVFSSLLPADFTMASVYQPVVLLFSFLTIISVGGLSGFFPGLILAKLKTNSAMKPDISHRRSFNISPRQVLTVGQFIIAQLLVGLTVIIVSQIDYSINKDLGFDKEAVVSVRVPFDHKKRKTEIVSNHLTNIPGVSNHSFGANPPLDFSTRSKDFKFKNGEEVIETHVYLKHGDHNYLDVYGLNILAGRNLGERDLENELIINETYSKALSFQNPTDAIGELISCDNSIFQIVGVVSDFHMSSTRAEIKPAAIYSSPQSHFMVHIKLDPQKKGMNDWNKTMSQIEGIWMQVYPDQEFSSSFIDDKMAIFYKTEQRMSQLLKWVTGMAVFISCLGLLGLAVFTVHRRTKEIGIRKVLGITVPELLFLLSKDSLKLVVIAVVLAAPISWMLAQKWLEDYAFRVDLSIWMFVFPGLQLVVIAFFTIASQALKAARLNPAIALRDE